MYYVESINKVIYRTSATGGGRDGRPRPDGGSHQVDLVVRKELGRPCGDSLNPQKLFALGYPACLVGTMRHYVTSRNV